MFFLFLFQIYSSSPTMSSPCFVLWLRAISKYEPTGACIRRSDLTEGFLRYEFGGEGAYIWRGLYMEEVIFAILRYCE